jgi:hypothetical protein
MMESARVGTLTYAAKKELDTDAALSLFAAARKEVTAVLVLRTVLKVLIF